MERDKQNSEKVITMYSHLYRTENEVKNHYYSTLRKIKNQLVNQKNDLSKTDKKEPTKFDTKTESGKRQKYVSNSQETIYFIRIIIDILKKPESNLGGAETTCAKAMNDNQITE